MFNPIDPDIIISILNSSPQIISEIEKEQFVVKDTGISPRIISHWIKQEIITNIQTKEHKTRKFDFSEFIWLKIVEEMRQFNISLTLIAAIRVKLFDGFTIADFSADKLDHLLSAIPEKYYIENKTTRSTLKQQIMLGGEKHHTSYFKLLIIITATVGENVALLFNKNGHFFAYFESLRDQFLANDEDRKILESSYINISITSQVIKYLNEEIIRYNDIIKGTFLLTNEEIAVFNTLKQNNLKSITIKFRNAKISTIETEEFFNFADPTKRLSEFILKDGYQQISFETQKGKIVNVKNIRKLKFDKG